MGCGWANQEALGSHRHHFPKPGVGPGAPASPQCHPGTWLAEKGARCPCCLGPQPRDCWCAGSQLGTCSGQSSGSWRGSACSWGQGLVRLPHPRRTTSESVAVPKRSPATRGLTTWRPRGCHRGGASPPWSWGLRGAVCAPTWGVWQGTEGCGLPCTCCWACSCLAGGWSQTAPPPLAGTLCACLPAGDQLMHVPTGTETQPGAYTQDRSCPFTTPGWASALSW